MSKQGNGIEGLRNGIYAIGVFSLFNFGASFYFFQIATDKDLNFVSVALTFFEIFLIVALATGFWMIRREAIEKAEDAAREEARECVEEIAQKLLEAKLQPLVFRGITKLLNDRLVEKGLSEVDVDGIMSTLDN